MVWRLLASMVFFGFDCLVFYHTRTAEGKAPVQRTLPQPGVQGACLHSAELGCWFHILRVPRRAGVWGLNFTSLLHWKPFTWPSVFVIPLPRTKLRWRACGPKTPGHPSVQMTYLSSAKLGWRRLVRGLLEI